MTSKVSRCINCGVRFKRNDVYCYYGAKEAVGPFCEVCDDVIKVHTRFLRQRDEVEAAPELLAACRVVLAAVVPDAVNKRAMLAVVAAIAKAEGQQ